MWYIHTMECYTAIKRNWVLLFAATWMELALWYLKYIRQRKINTVCNHLYVEPKKKKKEERN